MHVFSDSWIWEKFKNWIPNHVCDKIASMRPPCAGPGDFPFLSTPSDFPYEMIPTEVSFLSRQLF